MSKLKLYQFYKEIPVNTVRKSFQQFVLPTEVVLRSLTPPIPRFARAYDCDLFAPFDVPQENGQRLLYTAQEMQAAFPERYNRSGLYGMSVPVVLMELYENSGDDGHTDMELRGWTLVLKGEIPADFYTANNWNEPLRQKLQPEPYSH